MAGKVTKPSWQFVVLSVAFFGLVVAFCMALIWLAFFLINGGLRWIV